MTFTQRIRRVAFAALASAVIGVGALSASIVSGALIARSGADFRRCPDRARAIRHLASESPFRRRLGAERRTGRLAPLRVWTLGLHRRMGLVLGVRRLSKPIGAGSSFTTGAGYSSAGPAGSGSRETNGRRLGSIGVTAIEYSGWAPLPPDDLIETYEADPSLLGLCADPLHRRPASAHLLFAGVPAVGHFARDARRQSHFSGPWTAGSQSWNFAGVCRTRKRRASGDLPRASARVCIDARCRRRGAGPA